MSITEQDQEQTSHRTTLGILLRGADFRRLLTVRMISQLADGVFQVSLAAYVIFSPERQSSPADIAGVLAVMLLPFSVIGPFAGVLLDRWRRRQVLRYGNVVRFCLGLCTAGLLLARAPEWLFFAAALLVTALNRFILAGLSASLPHVVGARQLVTANAISPTLGTVAAATGGVVGFGVHQLLPPGRHADALLVTLSALLYLTAAAATRKIAPDLLGPDRHPGRPTLRQAIGTTGRELLAGLRHLTYDCRPALHALGAATLARFCYGVLIVIVLMLSRYTFNDPRDSAGGLATLGQAVGLSAVGFFLAAVVSPTATRRLGLPGWMITCLAAATVFVPALGLLFSPAPALLAALLLGLVTQGTKICTDTLVQESVEDDYRGRVFAIYDVLVNVAFVAAAGLTALILPLNGRSVGVVLGVSLLYAVGAALYARASRRTSVIRATGPDGGSGR